jgi:hypothetical protein
MSLRRTLPLALAILSAACKPDVPSRTTVTDPSGNPTSVADYAVFDPAAGTIPQPNDISLSPTAIATATGAQQELLLAFATAGGFPNDQEVPIQIDFTTLNIGDRSASFAAPNLDLTTFRTPAQGAPTYAVLELPPGATTPALADIDEVGAPGSASVYPAPGTTATLKITRKPTPASDPIPGSRRWKAGTRYIVALRGGANGVKTAEGRPIYAQSTLFLILTSIEQNRQIVETDLPSTIPHEQRPATVAALNQIRAGFVQLLPAVFAAFGAADAASQQQLLADLVVLQTFHVAAAAGTYLVVDESASVVPFPSDLLLDGAQAAPRVRDLSSSPSLAAAAAGLKTLDGFSTTAMWLAPASGPVRSATVATAGPARAVFVYDLSDPANPQRVPDVADQVGSGGSLVASYLTQPPAISQTVSGLSVSTTIGLQPAVPVPLSPTASILLPPFKEATRYAVVVTSRVKDAAGKAIVRPTVGKILLFTNPVAASRNPGAASLLAGVSSAEAVTLERMRQDLQPALQKLTADSGLTKDDVVLAYTVRTQTVTGRANAAGDASAPSAALQLAALPYSGALAKGSPACQGIAGAIGADPAALDCTKPIGAPAVAADAAAVAALFARYGVESIALATTPATLPGRSNLAAIYEAQLATVNLLDDATGAFNPDPTKAKPEVIPVLLAVPVTAAASAAVGTCAGSLAPLAAAGKRCVPLAVFLHGIADWRGDMLMIADALAAKGIAVAALDLPKFGDRSWCNPAGRTVPGLAQPVPECAAALGSQCVPNPAWANQGDPPGARPGLCRKGSSITDPPGDLTRAPVLNVTGTFAFSPNAGKPIASSEYFVTANFFRLRDTFRQGYVDVSALVQAFAPPPATPPSGSAVFDDLFGRGLVLDPGRVYVIGHSGGAVQGTVHLAVNSRLSRGVLNALGATMVDALTNAPSFKPQIDALFASIGVNRNDPAQAAKYLQTISVAKWVLDPADPINFARFVGGADRLPDLLHPGTTQAQKPALAQLGLCDQTVANPYNSLLIANLGIPGIALAPPSSPGTGRFQWLTNPVSGFAFPPEPTPPTNPFDPYPAGCSAGVAHRVFTDFGKRSDPATGAVQAQNTQEASVTGKAQDFAGQFLAADAAAIPELPTLVAP